MMQQNNQAGFTLLEVLMVLSVMAILFLLSAPVVHSLVEKKAEEKILQQLQYDILYIQNQAIGTTDYIRIIPYETSYLIEDKNQKKILRELPKGWEIDPRTLKEISFTVNGSIRKSGKMKVETPNNTYLLIFPLGKGRGYLEKQ